VSPQHDTYRRHCPPPPLEGKGVQKYLTIKVEAFGNFDEALRTESPLRVDVKSLSFASTLSSGETGDEPEVGRD
jgi:hypothetical protein